VTLKIFCKEIDSDDSKHGFEDPYNVEVFTSHHIFI